MSHTTSPPGLAESFTRIVHHLQAMVAQAIFVPAFRAQRNAFSQLVLLWKRLNDLTDRLTNASLEIIAPPPPANPNLSTRRGRRSRSSSRMPGTVGWLIRMLGAEATELGIELKHLLASAEFAVLLEADPKLARLLRPLCRMLCIERSPRLPPALFAPTPAKPPKSPPARIARPVVATPEWLPPETARTACPWMRPWMPRRNGPI